MSDTNDAMRYAFHQMLEKCTVCGGRIQGLFNWERPWSDSPGLKHGEIEDCIKYLRARVEELERGLKP